MAKATSTSTSEKPLQPLCDNRFVHIDTHLSCQRFNIDTIAFMIVAQGDPGARGTAIRIKNHPFTAPPLIRKSNLHPSRKHIADRTVQQRYLPIATINQHDCTFRSHNGIAAGNSQNTVNLPCC